MATAKTESTAAAVLMGLNKQNGQLRGQPKPTTLLSGPQVQGKAVALQQKTGGPPQEGGGGIKFGDDWKTNLHLPPKDTRVRTSVSTSSCPWSPWGGLAPPPALPPHISYCITALSID